MFSTAKRIGLLSLIWMASIIVLVACSQAQPETVVVTRLVEAEPVVVTQIVEGEVVEVEVTRQTVEEVEVVITATPQPNTVDSSWPDMSWDEVVAEANGQTVNWNYWGGSTSINTYVSEYIAPRLLEEYNITLNPVLINDTVEAVNKVLGESEAGRTTDGSIDLIWINGENFKTLRQADLLFGPYAQYLPNHMAYVNPDDPAIQFDFGFPVNGYESLWTASQFVMEYDSAVVPEPPATAQEYVAWACENPGLTTYPAPPDFTGTAFLTHIFYEYTGGHEQWQGRVDDEMLALFEEKAPAVWDALNELEACLWQGGQTYPSGPVQMEEMLNNGEIAIWGRYGPVNAQNLIRDGRYPDTIRTYLFDTGGVANASYVAIPFNSPNKAAALVTANLLMDPAAMLEKFKPDVWGDFTPLDLSLVPEDIRAQFDAVDLGEATLPPSALQPKLPPLSADLLPIFEAGWRENVLEN